MGTIRKSTALALLEAGLLIGGILLLVTFAWVRMDQARQLEEGLAKFDEMALAKSSGAESEESEFGDALAVPDQTLWSEQRVEAYRLSAASQDDVPLAILSIDRLNLEVPVYNGADERNLNRGAARIKGTAAVDAIGNLGIAGHRDGFFRGLKDAAEGDLIELRTRETRMNYRITGITIVDPTDVSVLAPTQDRTLTLVTCYPFYFVGQAPKRYIVTARAEQWLASNWANN